MNPIASINKSLRELEAALPKCKTPESRGKARGAISAACSRMGLGFFPLVVPGGDSVGVAGETVNIAIPEPVGGVLVGVEGQATPEGEKPVEAKETGKDAVLEPVSDHDHEVLVKVEHEKIEKVPEGEKEIGGWPVEGRVTIMGLAANRRSLRGILEDKRGVCVERHFRTWKVGERVGVRLIRAGANPLYRVMQ